MFEACWADACRNGLVDALVRNGGESLKSDFEMLLAGGSVFMAISESIVFEDLTVDDDAIWSLLLASGYVRADNARRVDGAVCCEITLTNHEIHVSFDDLRVAGSRR